MGESGEGRRRPRRRRAVVSIDAAFWAAVAGYRRRCPVCEAPPGEKCRNYRGQSKQTCPARLVPVESCDVEAPAAGATQGLFW